MKEFNTHLILALFLFALRQWVVSDTGYKDSFRDAAIGLIVATIATAFIKIAENQKHIRLWFQSMWHPNRPVRVSMSYLFRIEVDGHFLLIRNHKKPERGFQPVGGVYKFLQSETSSLFQTLGVIPDTRIRIDEDSRNDLRCTLNQRRNLLAFLKWFNSKTDRELDPWREFYEELINDEELLNRADFPYIQYNYIKQDYEGIKPPDFFNIDEFLYADIILLKPENQRQHEELRRLFTNRYQQDKYIFATPDEIRQGHTADGRAILPHAKKILC